MRYWTVAFSGIASIAGAGDAAAESSITLYGQIDTGLYYRSSAGANPATGRAAPALSLLSGNEYTSRWGITGREDLGSRISLVFKLESGFNAASGAGNLSLPFPNDTGSLFDRGANVGLSSPIGTLLFGRNMSSLYEALAAGDPTGFMNFGSLSTILLENSSNLDPKLGLPGATAGTYSATNGGLTYLWVNNSIKYMLPSNEYGLSGGALYALGGTPGQFSSGAVRSANLNWNHGPLGIVSGYFDRNAQTPYGSGIWQRAYTLGLTYKLNSVATAFNFSTLSNPQTGARQNFYYTAATWLPTPTVFLIADWLHLQDLHVSSAGADLYRLGVNYFLSKSTTLYLDGGYVNNKARGIMSADFNAGNLANAATVGRNQLAVAVGIRKWF